MSDLDKKNGVIYILTNPSFEGIIKIGYATDINARLSQLNDKSCLPFSFRLYATYDVTKDRADIFFHYIIDQLNPKLRTVETLDRCTRKREFFVIDPDVVYNLLDNIAKLTDTEDRLKKYTASDYEIQEEEFAYEIREKQRRNNFSFTDCKIYPGEIIEFANNPKITAKVIDDRHVEYNGEKYTLSGLTGNLMNRDAVQGPYFWKLNGDRLTEIRDKLESENI